MQTIFPTLLLLLFCFVSCKQEIKKENRFRHADYGGEDDNGTFHDLIFNDGEYCAEVKRFNTKLNKTSTYTLLVDIEDAKLVKIYFPKGGWLDESHFTAPKPNDEEFFEFTDDRGNEFEVAILKDDESCEHKISDQ